mgnify:CR=1 FL=1
MPKTNKFRIGATSYILEDDLTANADYLSSHVEEMELVLFDRDSGFSNLPDEKMQDRLSRVGEKTGLVYTVHLPLDLSLHDDGKSVALAEKVLKTTKSLPVFGVVAHIEGWYWQEFTTVERNPALYADWVTEGQQLIRWLKDNVPEDWEVCIENTEGFPADEVQFLINGLQVSRCIDVGHLLKQGHPDPLGYVQANLAQCRIMHLHGLDASGKDHHSVALLSEVFLDRLLTILVENEYDGVLTLEVFGMDDFETSMQAIRNSFTRIGVGWDH